MLLCCSLVPRWVRISTPIAADDVATHTRTHTCNSASSTRTHISLLNGQRDALAALAAWHFKGLKNRQSASASTSHAPPPPPPHRHRTSAVAAPHATNRRLLWWLDLWPARPLASASSSSICWAALPTCLRAHSFCSYELGQQQHKQQQQQSATCNVIVSTC